MEKILKTTLFIFMICVLTISSTTNVFAQENNDSKITKLIDDEVSELVDNKCAKGAVVSIVKNDKVLLCKGYGYADKKNGIKADGDNTAFRIGSISKTFVALSALQLVQEGKLDMNAPISQYLGDDFPEFKYPITMQNLLTYTAGFENMNEGLFIFKDQKQESLSESLKKYRPDQVYMSGEVTAYSNYGIALAGYVVEKISNKPFYEYAEENIFNPLEMNNSTFNQFSSPAPVVSEGYGSSEEGIVNLYPTGSMMTTAQDMAGYMKFLVSDNYSNILNNELKTSMFERQYTMDEEFDGVGYTWERYMRNGHLVVLKPGETDNFSSLIFIYPDEKLAVFISFNTKINTNDIFEKVTENLYGKEKEKTVSADGRKNLKDISGYYRTTVSNFTKTEKVINPLISERVHISGNLDEGFNMDGKKVEAIGEDFYSSNLGKIKFIEKNGREYICSEGGQVFIRIPWYESNQWQCFTLILFIIFSFIGFITAIIFIKNRKKYGKYSIIASIPAIIIWIIVAATSIVIITCMNSISMAGLNILFNFFRIISPILFVSSLLIIPSTIYYWHNKRSIFLRLFYLLWSVSSLIFIWWLHNVNLL